jgi:uncharacterized lipoprotein
MTKRSVTVAALAALALLVGCSREQEAEIEEEMPVAAPAPELTAPPESIPAVTDPTTDTTVVPVP